jgi:hypothetical protein
MPWRTDHRPRPGGMAPGARHRPRRPGSAQPAAQDRLGPDARIGLEALDRLARDASAEHAFDVVEQLELVEAYTIGVRGKETRDPQAVVAASDRVRERRQRLRERLRTAWIGGAEEEWRQRRGPPITAEELKPVLQRYPGDV